LGSFDSQWGKVVGCFEQSDNETLGFVEGKGFLDQLSDYSLHMKNTAP
jgi:hypothetical protein